MDELSSCGDLAGWDVEYLGRPGRYCGLKGPAAAHNGAPGRVEFWRPGTHRGRWTSARCFIRRRRPHGFVLGCATDIIQCAALDPSTSRPGCEEGARHKHIRVGESGYSAGGAATRRAANLCFEAPHPDSSTTGHRAGLCGRFLPAFTSCQQPTP